jgi:membrane-associated phospholipid phosphatase
MGHVRDELPGNEGWGMHAGTRGNGLLGRRRQSTAPVFAAAQGTLSRRLGQRLRGFRPFLAGLFVWAAGLVVLGIAIVGLGLLLIHLLLPAGLGRLDASVSGWFVHQRTPTLDTLTRIGSDLGTTPVIIGVAAVAVIVLAIGRHWLQIGFLVGALTLEFLVFLTSTLVVDRIRPMVPRLDPTPVTSSYPSGHAAAALTLYVGLAIVIWSLVRSSAIRAIVWIVAVALPVFVGVSRLYRGMHHLTDVIASLLLGCGALLFALLVTRSAVADSEARAEERPLPAPAPRSEIQVTS